ncbi:MAG TPA: SUMF1/EgtB/PvdO family nonheme iron enzyme, partial [Polyangiaceae bacterium]|nr:SUMF1/EgtB/PvdO family nonheme iron enzyme [Polyangiaceae bacterium]
EVRRGYFDTVPRHEVRTGGYLIGRTEVTYGAWLDYLEALEPAERARRTPKSEAKVGQSGGLRLERRGEQWWLTITPSERTYEAHAGEPLIYSGRKERARQDWRRLPVTGISSDDAAAYAAWLDRTGRVPGARLCTEYEWERAARGADGRPFPHGEGLAGAEANYGETYGGEGKGPDEVGSHPASRSPFGLDDTSGNAFEWARSSLDEGQFVVRGGSYLHDRKTAQLMNRTVVSPALRDTGVGVRLCATFPRPSAPPPARTKGQSPLRAGSSRRRPAPEAAARGVGAVGRDEARRRAPPGVGR